MNNLLNKLMGKINAGVAAMFKMTAIEWVAFVAIALLLVFMVSNPLLTILLFVVGWFVSVGFRNAIKKAIAKWKS